MRSARAAALLVGLVAVVATAIAPITTAVAAPPARVAAAAGSQPDIVLLMVDDLPQIDDRIWRRLPTIKRLFLDHGVRFTQYIGNDPLCCPGRANVLTGQWSHHHGVTTNDGRLFDPRETIATELHRVGYWTGIFGKYFNRTLEIADRTPPGWDRTFLTSGSYYDYTALVDGAPVRFGHRPSDYSTSQVRVRSVAALKAIPDPSVPRFLWLAPFAIHAGFDEQGVRHRESVPAPRDRGATACRGLASWVTPATTESDRSDKPAFVRRKHATSAGPLAPRCESLLSVDRMLAAVLAELSAEGRPDPLVILTADNGMGWGAHGWFNKRVPYATPIPLFVSWPPVLGTAPSSRTTTITNVDIAPTLCAIAGCAMGPFPNGHGVDGLSFLPVLLGTSTTMGRETIFEEHSSTGEKGEVVPWKSLRTTEEASIGTWVYTAYVSGEKELYDLSGGPCWTWQEGDPGDPCELTNLAGDPDHATIQARLAATLAAREDHPLSVLRRPR